jgi:hypothetical protein
MWLQERIPIRHVFDREWTTHTKHDNRYKINDQHNERGLIQILDEHENLPLVDS